ncbi:VanZ family protein [Paenibacillus gansuensis]|uniref:VanZ family protein n=1 Tax=Paenibacillus gansuensis TaxID=306542 RepID=A0ABW5PCN6_9BACL
MKPSYRWIPAILWMALIFYASSRTGDELNTLLPFFHRFFPKMESFDWGHFIAYFGLALTYLFAFPPARRTTGVKAAVVVMCLLYGITDEYHQSFVGNRTPDPADLRNDTIGAALAMLFVSIPAVGKRWNKL